MTDARDAARDVERYEQLRVHALEGGPSGFSLGLALLERRGVAAWTRAWSSTAPGRSPATVTAAAVLPPVSADDELVGVLASMALACVAAG
ncbi:MAG TPA: hypothetical protein VMA77_30785 [Solirubrobacteraceae bacterium]|nr:hypothetical protein [Solirubrobacteraceae bacterium]